MLSLSLILFLAALVVVLMASVNKAPLWVGVLLHILGTLTSAGMAQVNRREAIVTILCVPAGVEI
jgi:hypothetical protein